MICGERMDREPGGRNPPGEPPVSSSDPPSQQPHLRASEFLKRVVDRIDQPEVSVGGLVDAIGDRAFGLVTLAFAVPNCIPGPPGLGSVLGIPLIIFGLQLAAGRRVPWLPRFVGRRRLKIATLVRVLDFVGPVLRRIERVCRPRVTVLVSRRAERALGVAIFTLACAIAMPLPMTNMVPAIGIGVISLGLLEEDGVTVLAGLAIGLIGVAIVIAVVYAIVFGVSLAVT